MIINVALRTLLAWLVLCVCHKEVSGAAVIPFEIGGGIVFIKAAVNGAPPQSYILDTGATENLLTPQAALRAGLGEPKGKLVACPVAIGDQPALATSFILHDPLQALSLRLDSGINYAGILGYPFLSNSVVTIDYQLKTIDWTRRLTPGVATGVPREGIQVPFILRDRLIHVSGRVNGRVPLTFLVDTGSAEVMLLPRAAEVLRLSTSDGNRVDGIRFATLDRISVGKATVTNVSVVVQRLRREGVGALSYDGILGYPFLSRFKTTFNYRDQTLTFEAK